MKNVLLVFFCLMLLSCAASKEQQKNDRVSGAPPFINCPDDGNCSFEVFKNSALNLSYDSHGKLFPELTEGEKIVIKYHYKRKTLENVMDDSYSEYLYFEFDSKDKQIILQDKDLSKVKMLFGRICYCKGNMGYYPVEQGSLFLFNANGNLQVRTSFKIHKVPQVIHQIDENINF